MDTWCISGLLTQNFYLLFDFVGVRLKTMKKISTQSIHKGAVGDLKYLSFNLVFDFLKLT